MKIITRNVNTLSNRVLVFSKRSPLHVLASLLCTLTFRKLSWFKNRTSSCCTLMNTGEFEGKQILHGLSLNNGVRKNTTIFANGLSRKLTGLRRTANSTREWVFLSCTRSWKWDWIQSVLLWFFVDKRKTIGNYLKTFTKPRRLVKKDKLMLVTTVLNNDSYFPDPWK